MALHRSSHACRMRGQGNRRDHLACLENGGIKLGDTLSMRSCTSNNRAKGSYTRNHHDLFIPSPHKVSLPSILHETCLQSSRNDASSGHLPRSQVDMKLYSQCPNLTMRFLKSTSPRSLCSCLLGSPSLSSLESPLHTTNTSCD